MPKLQPFLLLLCLMLPAPLLWGDEPAPAAAKTAAAEVPKSLASPRATVETFLKAMGEARQGHKQGLADALQTLDLSEVNPLVRRERGEDLAWLLLEALDKSGPVELKRVPRKVRAESWRLRRFQNGEIRLSRQADGRWLFDKATLRALPAIVEELARHKSTAGTDQGQLPLHIRLRQALPGWLRHRTLVLQNWQWLGLLITIALGVILDRIAQWLARHAMRRWLRRFPEVSRRIDDADQRLRPLGLALMAFVWWLGILLLGLPEEVLLVLLVAVKLLASLAAVWTAWRLVDVVSALLAERAAATDNRMDDVLVPLVRRILKIFIAVAGVVFVADNLNIDITGLLAGLGLGGLAFALAAKDLVQNFFGSLTILMDRTFTIGDWIIVDDIEGTVEHLGFRSTRIRTFYNSLVTIPNSRFITAAVDNMGARRYRRYKQKFGLTYDTPPEKVEAFCEGLREIVRQHPYMRKDYFQIWFNDLGASALEILVYVFWETPDWTTELRERHRFLLDAMRLAHELGVEFAFPTQTIHLYQEEPAPPDGSSPSLEAARETARRIVRQGESPVSDRQS